MSDKDNNILKYNSGEKYMRVPFVMYVIECLLENISTSHNDPNKSSTKIIHCLHIVHLTIQKISLVMVEIKAV